MTYLERVRNRNSVRKSSYPHEQELSKLTKHPFVSSVSTPLEGTPVFSEIRQSNHLQNEEYYATGCFIDKKSTPPL